MSVVCHYLSLPSTGQRVRTGNSDRDPEPKRYGVYCVTVSGSLGVETLTVPRAGVTDHPRSRSFGPTEPRDREGTADTQGAQTRSVKGRYESQVNRRPPDPLSFTLPRPTPALRVPPPTTRSSLLVANVFEPYRQSRVTSRLISTLCHRLHPDVSVLSRSFVQPQDRLPPPPTPPNPSVGGPLPILLSTKDREPSAAHGTPPT